MPSPSVEILRASQKRWAYTPGQVASEDAQADAQPHAGAAEDAAADAGNEPQPAQP